jgi:hypothetical protein
MKNFRLIGLLLLATCALSLPRLRAIEQITTDAGGMHIGTNAADKIGFYGVTPVVKPANTNTSREALEALGLLATGGADPADVFDLTQDNTLGDGVDMALGTTTGTKIGTATNQKLGFYNATPITQRANANGTALTDNTGGGTSDATLADGFTSGDALTDNSTGSAGTTIAAGVGVNTVTIPLTSLATGLSTSAIDLLTNYTPGYRFKILGFSFVTTVAGTGTSASQVFNLEIGTTNLTGGVLTLALADTDTIGKVKAATAITAANVGTSTDTISIEMAASGTVFTAGAGYFVLTIQNMDTADAVASLSARANTLRTDTTTQNDNDAKIAELANEMRAVLVALGLHKGGA